MGAAVYLAEYMVYAYVCGGCTDAYIIEDTYRGIIVALGLVAVREGSHGG